MKIMGLVVYNVAFWSIQPLVTTDMGREWGGLWPFLGGAGSPCNTRWPVPKPIGTKGYLDPSNRLVTIHQRHDQTDRHTGQTGQRSLSIRRTVLQTVAQKRYTTVLFTYLKDPQNHWWSIVEPFYTSHTTYYQSSVVTASLSFIFFEIWRDKHSYGNTRSLSFNVSLTALTLDDGLLYSSRVVDSGIALPSCIRQ